MPGPGLNLFLSLAGWEGGWVRPGLSNLGGSVPYSVESRELCGGVGTGKGKGKWKGCMWVGMLPGPGGWLNFGFYDAL